MNLGVETAGGLLDPRGSYFAWKVRSLGEVESGVGEFFAMVDGPLTAWAERRNTPEKVLDELSDPAAESQFRSSAAAVRAVAGLALLQGRPDRARSAVAGYQPAQVDEQERACSAARPG